MGETFRSLRHYNYRLWALGALISNIGTWMQRTAQDWIVLTQLTHESATAVGIVMSLQFGPQLLLLPFTGLAADRMNRRKLLLVTQASMGALALALGLLTLAGVVSLWHVYLLAFLLGCVTAFDAPARQTFVGELVGEEDLANAVALNSTSFHSARMIGPAIAGVLLGAVGSGWVFLINAASFGAVLYSLSALRIGELHAQMRAARDDPGGFLQGLRYVWRRRDLVTVMWMMFLVSTFGFNFQLFIPTMSVVAFRGGSEQYGALASVMAAGSVAGALFAARQKRPRLYVLLVSSALFGVGSLAAAIAPNAWVFGATLVFAGVFAQIYLTTTNSLVQLSTQQAMRGRVMALLLAIVLGCTPLGAPVVGWVADAFGPRWSVAVAAASGFATVLVGIRYLMRYGRRHLRWLARAQSQSADATQPSIRSSERN
ncbi:MAG: MFS transporter [Burkholderiaceae bacterium]|nr:MFS transporter [Burkholderiaceae bacterium]